MTEEKWIRKFLANNPFLTDRMKKLEEQRRVESIIMNDLGNIVAYQHSFIRTDSIDLVHLKKLVLTYKSNGENNNGSPKDFSDSFKLQKKNQQFANTEDTIRLINLANQLRMTLFQVLSFSVSADDDFSMMDQIHHLFDEIIYYRNLKCTKYRNTFAPLPLLRISTQDAPNSTPPSSKCHGFSKTLYRSSPYIDSTYLPTKSSIHQMQKSVKNENLLGSLKTLSNELNRTNKELLILKSDQQSTNILVRDFLQFPPFDVVRESPLYDEFNKSVSYSIKYVRSEITSLQKSLSDLISHIIPKLQSSVDCTSCFPQFETILDDNVQSSYCVELSKLQLLQKIIEDTDVFQPAFPDYESIKYIHFNHETFSKLNELKDKDINSLSQFLESAIEEYSHYLDSIFDENENLEHKRSEFTEKIEQWNSGKLKKLPSIPEDLKRKRNKLIYSTSQLRDKILNDQIETTQLLNDTIFDFKEKVKDLQINTPLFPLNFEDMLFQSFHQQPKMTWIDQKLDFHQIENKMKKKTVENLKKNAEELKIEINEKKQILNFLLERNKTKKSSKIDNADGSNASNSRKSTHCPKYICSICKIRQRDAIISLCGHTFCRRCLLILLRRGSQRCPHCDTFYSESNIKPIVW